MKYKIVNAAAECLVEYGIRGTTMERVAERIHISKRTLYCFFPDKHTLLTACLRMRIASSLLSLRSEVSSVGSLEAILRMNDSAFALFELPKPIVRSEFEKSDEVRRLLRDEYRAPLFDIMKGCLRRAKDDGFVASDTDEERTFVLFETLPLSVPYYETDPSVRYETFSYAARTCLAGICTDLGRKELEIINNDRK